MVKVITYGTYDHFHFGHARLLERAKALGDYLIVGVTSDNFDRQRGKINVQQSLIERIDAVKKTGLADEIIVEEYEGQKIDDIINKDVDIFTVGSDWVGTFDYLNEYCKVIYLDRTKGVSSSEIREEKNKLQLGLIGESFLVKKYEKESSFVNGVEVSGIITSDFDVKKSSDLELSAEFKSLIEKSDAVYLATHPENHFFQIKYALEQNTHVICESPVTCNTDEFEELKTLAKEKKLVLFDAIKTAYSFAYIRMLRMIESDCIGKIVSVDATCTSLSQIDIINSGKHNEIWNSSTAWTPTALLPVFHILGTKYEDTHTVSKMAADNFDLFTKIDFTYKNAVAPVKVGKGVKSNGELIVSGTKGYIYVPAPWWKTDYFEIHYEDENDNKKCFYKLDGEGIRYELISFVNSIKQGKYFSNISDDCSREIIRLIQNKNVRLIN